MQLVVIGLNHKTAPVEIREKFNFTRERIKGILRRLRGSDYIQEAVLVATCNRTELYLLVEQPEFAMAGLKRMVMHLAGDGYQKDYFYLLTGINCVRHLFYVASSLDSLVVGEGQILSQIKDAYALAKGQNMTSTMFNTLFQKAINVGKLVRTKTRIAYTSVSVSSAAVDMAMEIIDDLSEADVLVIGAGHMSELTIRHLIDKGARKIYVSNRSFDHAQELADKFNGTVIKFEHFLEHAAQADIIITSTGATHYVINADKMAKIMPSRNKDNPLILIDIAVPRDVDPEVGSMDGVILYNIDDLEDVVDLNKNLRSKEAKMAEDIIDQELIALRERLRYLSMRPVMVQLGEKMDFLRERVLKRALVKLPELDEAQRRIIEQMSYRLTHKFLREPMIAMNNVAGTAKEEEYKKFISELFLLDTDGEEELGDENKYDYWN